MRAELPVFSFLSLFGLILILPGQVKSPTIPAVSVIFWLFVSNLIHGVNSIVWAGNTAIHSPAWCDIATKLLLGAMVAVPGAFLCICRHLEFATSRREVAEKANRLRQSIFEVSLCIVSPIVYMALHTIVQDHRFSIVQDLGCQAAVYNYLPALILVWLPPLLLSLISLLYCASALILAGKSYYNTWPLFPQAPTMTVALFLRRTAFGITGMLYILVVYVIITTWSTSNFAPSISVAQLHANFSQVEILPTDSDARLRMELVWWSIPVWSILLCLLSAFGEETRKGYKALFAWIGQRIGGVGLPLHGKADFLSTTPTTPVHLLKSGWDDELNIKTSDLKTQRSASTFSSGLGSPISPEEEFAVSTLHYLESNAARQLRLPSPPPTAHPAGLPSPVSPTDKTPDTMLAPPRTSIDSASPSVSRGNSILSSAAWPEPPRSIPSPTDGRLHLPRSPTRATQSPTLSRSGSQSSVRSMSAGRLDASGYPMLPNARPAHFRDVPFNGPGVMPLSSPPPPRRNASSASAKAKAMARVHVRPLSPVGKRTRNASDEVIYMTVVHESQ